MKTIEISIDERVFVMTQRLAAEWDISPDELYTIALTAYIARYHDPELLDQNYYPDIPNLSNAMEFGFGEKIKELEELHEHIVSQLYFQANWAPILQQTLHDSAKQRLYEIHAAVLSHFEFCHKEKHPNEQQDIKNIDERLMAAYREFEDISLFLPYERNDFLFWKQIRRIEAFRCIEGVSRFVIPNTIEFDIKIADEIKSVLVPIKLSQVLLNILLNAVQSLETSDTVDPKRIAINIIRVRDDLYIEIWDNGDGIAPENIDKIWLKGFTTKKYHPGVGLKISKFILHEMNGKISADSVPRAYTRFIVSLPVDFEHRGESL